MTIKRGGVSHNLEMNPRIMCEINPWMMCQDRMVEVQGVRILGLWGRETLPEVCPPTVERMLHT